MSRVSCILRLNVRLVIIRLSSHSISPVHVSHRVISTCTDVNAMLFLGNILLKINVLLHVNSLTVIVSSGAVCQGWAPNSIKRRPWLQFYSLHSQYNLVPRLLWRCPTFSHQWLCDTDSCDLARPFHINDCVTLTFMTMCNVFTLTLMSGWHCCSLLIAFVEWIKQSWWWWWWWAAIGDMSDERHSAPLSSSC